MLNLLPTVRKAVLLALCLCLSATAQTLGQLRLVDFSARTPATIASVAGMTVTTAQPHGLREGAAVYIYPPISWATDENGPFGSHGNRGRGYFNINVIDATHFTIASEMYTNATVGIGNGIAAGDKIVPLTTYYVRQGPKLFLDGPINRGTWSSSTTYRALESVTASDGNLYESIADGNKNHQPPDSAWWVQLDPNKVGPGTFTASLRSSSGKTSGGNFAWTELQSLQKTDWPAAYTYNYSGSVWPEGFGSTLAAEHWMGNGDSASYNQALLLATQLEDLADGTVGCDITAVSCGHLKGGFDAIDQTRTDFNTSIQAGLGMIYDTLTPSQKAGVLDKLLNDYTPAHNGVDTVSCTPNPINPGLGSISAMSWVVTGSGFLSYDGLIPGSVIMVTGAGGKTALGRVKSVDSDTRITLEQTIYSQANILSGGHPVTSNFSAWWYVKPFGYRGAHSCGAVWIYRHYSSSPRMIPGLESQYANVDYPPITSPDDSPRQNKTITGLNYLIAIGLLTANDDIRGVRLAEQSINYYMTQTLAQENKSRNTGLDGHGTQYGTGRTAANLAGAAFAIRNSLVTTPPGVTTGVWLKNMLETIQYDAWMSNATLMQPWATGYGRDINQHGASDLYYVALAPMFVAAMYPDDPFTPHLWDYLKKRRNDYAGNTAGGWKSVLFITRAWPLFDPTVTPTSISVEPPQRGLIATDLNECIAAGLYCRADAAESSAFSNTGWNSNSDAQVFVEGQAAIPPVDDDNYGTAGNITILQNHGSNSAYLLGGNGLGVGPSYGSANTPHSGLYDGNTISIYDPSAVFNTGLRDLVSTKSGFYAFANTDRWAGDPVTGVADNSYIYMRVNYTPKMREAVSNYDPAAAVQKSFYSSAANAQNVTREVMHLKSGSGQPNYLVVYDSVQIGTPHQLRAYWHLQMATYLNPTTTRNVDWVAVNGASKTASLTVPSSGRLNLAALPVAGSANANIALTSEDFNPPMDPSTSAKPIVGLSQLSTIKSWSWNSGVLTMTMGTTPIGAFPFPTNGSVNITITMNNPSMVNGTWPVTGYSTTGPTVSIAMPNDPGPFVASGYVQYPGWCSYATKYNPSGSCAGMYWRPYDGNRALPDSSWPGTYRLHVCASQDGSTCDNENNAEWITVLQPSASTSSTMPALRQPTCTAYGGSCTAVEIQDAAYPKVAVFARQGTLVNAVAFSTTHSGTAQYVISGLAPGGYNASLNGRPISDSPFHVAAGDTSLSFRSPSGAISVSQVAPILMGALPSSTTFACTQSGSNPTPQSIAIDCSGGLLDDWTATNQQSWLSQSPGSGTSSGNFFASVDCSSLAPGSYSDSIAVVSTTEYVSNSPISVPVQLTVYPPPAIAAAVLPATAAGQPYQQSLTVTGGQSPYTWGVTSGSLPAGLSLSGGGQIIGTAAAPGETAFEVTVTDGGGASTTQSFRMIVHGPASTTVTGTAALQGRTVVR